MCADEMPIDLAPFADYDGPPIFACASRDELLRRWRDNGDEHALKILLAAMQPDLQPEALRAERDREIQELATWLESILPGATRNAIAELLARGGQAIAGGAPLRPTAFPKLNDDERAEFAARLDKILAWSPTTKRGFKWPQKRQLTEIIE